MYVTISTDTAAGVHPIPQSAGHPRARTRIAEGAYLFFEGDEVDNLYLIESGSVRLTRVLEDGRRQIIAFGFPGDIIGFPAEGLYNTDCDALRDAVLRPIPRRLLEDGSADPALHKALMAAALREISGMQDHFMMLGRKSASEKVASFLGALSERVGTRGAGAPEITLPMGRADIADFLGLTTETVSRCFSALRKSGVIRLRGIHTVEILAADALAQRAQSQLN
ncbi:helix-turn-helix domain-containing protein [Poseidonocella sedimentorum]|uniref:CRP/FNR family transcriptional regulator, anaerobic regulatory protein n=1 Tax=Poseidonocella sedimentorum TaxID=871652 RepID=A0A1I6DW04_9RHOB|nr:helix-turn-helix domain-containing protein [Poseidonocella sedimentorum]SFR09468.1 CRP/FNR family transcriptional regulator, anaerobic regulatory protein [Poseidonocella sedimentorum]